MSMNFVTFNQDYSHLAVGTSRGFRIYTTDPFAKIYETKQSDISLMEMLFSTSLVALILSPRKLRITNTKRQSTICELTFPTAVLAVRMNRKRLVVVLEDQIYLYDISNMKLLTTIETSPNPHAICALSPSSENCYLAYPLPQKTIASSFAPPSHAPPSGTHIPPTSGDVLIFDALKLEAINVVEAHRSPLSCITLNNTGTLLATASDKGTIIRVFSIPDVHKLYHFRRGSTPSRIYSMSFNTSSSLLCVSSATDTVHIFKLSSPSSPTSSSSASAYRLTSPEKYNPSAVTTAASPSSSSSNKRERRSSSPGSDDNTHTPMPQDEPTTSPTRKPNGTLLGLIRRTSQNVGTTLAASVGSYLSSAVAEMWEPARDFAWLKIPKSPPPGGPLPSGTGAGGGGGGVGGGSGLTGQPLRSLVAMSSNTPQVMVVTNQGHFYVFNIDLERGGEGSLVKIYEVGGEGEGLEGY